MRQETLRPRIDPGALNELHASLPGHQFLGELAHGGSSIIYRAHDIELDRDVAIKVVIPDVLRAIPSTEHILHEAKLLARVDHPAILHVYGAGQVAGLQYIVLQYIEGETLDRILQPHVPLPTPRALEIVRQAAEALAAAHAVGVIHRDVKPSNLLLGRDGFVRVMDFGIAWGPETSTARFSGTPLYSSPEQCRLDPLDVRTDVYSLGVVLYQMLSGTLPHIGESAQETIEHVLRITPPPLGDIAPALPRPVGHLVDSMIDPEPSRRPADMESVIRSIDRIQSSPRISSRRRTVASVCQQGQTSSRSPRYTSALLTGLTACFLLTGLIVAGGLLDSPPELSVSDPAPNLTSAASSRSHPLPICLSLAPFRLELTGPIQPVPVPLLENRLRQSLTQIGNIRLVQAGDPDVNLHLEASVTPLDGEAILVSLYVRRSPETPILFGSAEAGPAHQILRLIEQIVERFRKHLLDLPRPSSPLS